MPTIYLNDQSLEDLGLTVEDGGPDIRGLTIERERVDWPNRAGGLASPRATVSARILRFVAIAQPTSAAARTALLDAYADALTGRIEVRFDDAPARVLHGRCRVYDAEVVGAPRWVNLDPRITVEIVCDHAAKWDREAQALVITSTPVEIPCGTLAHEGELLYCGALAGEVRIRYRGITGTLLDELVLTIPTGALAANESLFVLLSDRALVKSSTTGILTDVYNWKTGGAWFTIDPRDGDRAADAWPSLETTAGTALYRWRRNYQN
jgi:hypothetical protein